MLLALLTHPLRHISRLAHTSLRAIRRLWYTLLAAMSEVTGFVQSESDVKTTELVLVCCHATYMGDGSNLSEDQWIVQPFQRSDPLQNKPGEFETFIQHILSAAMVVANNPQALLIFSGGRTTPAPRSEAESFATETYATDSYQNLIFSIIRFRQLTGAFPRTISVITHAFKERRFLELHAPAIKWPHHRIRVQGLNAPFTLDELNFTQRGEHDRAYRCFAEDPYGVRMPLLQKRLARNWNIDRAHVFLGWKLEPAVMGLLEWQGGLSGWETFPRRLPWEDDTSSAWMYGGTMKR